MISFEAPFPDHTIFLFEIFFHYKNFVLGPLFCIRNELQVRVGIFGPTNPSVAEK
jgi:hypothetical protein